ncbi:DUF488 domain-containing protein [bacterium]|nr:DUF488 domain-containing protein [bacterium]
MRPLYTIGIGRREVPDLLRDLQANGIRFLIDVRSRPFSGHKPTFNRDELKNALTGAGLNYAHWPALGGFPTSEHVIRHGHVDYRDLARQPEFQDHLDRLCAGLEEDQAIAILCSEGRPEECHRSKCIGVELTERKVDVLHIDADGGLVTQEAVMGRLTKDQFSLPGLEPVMRSKRSWGDGTD